MCWQAQRSGPHWLRWHSILSSAPATETPPRLRVLFVSDVYFPRVNGVSTSIRTFRTDLRAAGVDSVLVAPAYPADAPQTTGRTADDELLLRRTLQRLDGRFDVVHVQTPFLAHYAGVGFARRRSVPVIATYHTLFEE